MTLYHPKHVSERKPGIDYDCVWCSGLMLANAVTKGEYPATLDEALDLRKASDDDMTSGSSIGDLLVGFNRRYGWAPTPVYLESALIDALKKPGTVAVVIGRPLNLPIASPFRRWTGWFPLLHCVVLLNDGGNRLWLMDPEGPKDGYEGERVEWDEVKRYYEGSGAAFDKIGRLALPDTSTEDPVSLLALDIEDYRNVRIPAGTTVYNLNAKPIRSLAKAQDRDALHRVIVGGRKYWLVRLPHDGRTEILMVRAGDVTTDKLQPLDELEPSA